MTASSHTKDHAGDVFAASPTSQTVALTSCFSLKRVLRAKGDR